MTLLPAQPTDRFAAAVLLFSSTVWGLSWLPLKGFIAQGLSGPLVKSLSGTVEKVLEEKIAEKREKLVEKMNKSLAKRKEKFRFPPAELLESPLGGLLPGGSAASATPAESSTSAAQNRR